MKPKHHKSQYFFKKNIFTGLSNFYELENRISALPQEERGDVFEVFAEAYIYTQLSLQASEIWPEGELPQKIRDKLGLPLNDMGIDGVFKTHANEYHAYQVKYRSNRKSLSWNEISTFLGLSDKSDQRMIFTNSDDLSSALNDRTNFFSIKGNDLDRLEVSDFQTIENWLKTGLINRKKYEPQKHQKEAIEAIVHAFEKNNRAKAIMACGTGKTLVALWVAEKLKAKSILVLLPSLALVKQTLHEWAKQNSWDDMFSYLCVCSDTTVKQGADEIILKKQELDFLVTTNIEQVKQYLQNKNITQKIIFSTYQSSPIIAQAMSNGFEFDLAIFDEAHKTASRTESSYAFSLEDKNIAIKKRLFLTATPRHFNINKKDKEGENRLVYSMDDESIYGVDAYTLSFSQAVSQGLICDYKILISCITKEEVDRSRIRRSDVTDIDGEIIKAEKIAHLIVMQNAIKDFGINYIFSFHNSVASAASFTTKNEGIGEIIPEFEYMHVSGQMSTKLRDSRITDFKQVDKAIMSNARCLTEGVDVPAVDMVAFMSPKRSSVDIIQAAGRAMRISHNLKKSKKYGYILLPVFIQQTANETVEQALETMNFDTIWDVLNAIQEHDEIFAEIINQMREDKGRGIGFNDSRLREKIIILGPKLLLNTLRESINVKIIERIGSSWNEFFGELLKFKELYGHCNVSESDDKQLATWLEKQRSKKRKQTLQKDRLDLLDGIGVNWNPLEVKWLQKFEELKQFKQKNGHCNVSESDNKQLATWLKKQRSKRRKQTLQKDHFDLLSGIGVKWNPLEAKWLQKFEELKQFKQKNGHCNVSESDDKQLATWLETQRSKQRKQMLQKDSFDLLSGIGVNWNLLEAKWLQKFEELKQFKQKNGHCNVSESDDKQLATWLETQRSKQKKQMLQKDSFDLLNGIGVNWNLLEVKWLQKFVELKQFKQKNGHCNVSESDNKQLATWLEKQRSKQRKQTLQKDHFDLLSGIGVKWNPLEAKWLQKFEELKQFKDLYGHCNVSDSYNKGLATWLEKQRSRKRTSKLQQDRVDILESIGIVWGFKNA